ncbi:hypothetical protein GX50_03484 [[Emmonsia] crescens]|uniref:Uncharacterized protein n=1 Tax=[Emmonsia] crescens TaxID=73230 RepID=A0A2B7ZLH0_9EURO|nr:hypothetical protein GX50_03484 [Emmonsia crescens]
MDPELLHPPYPPPQYTSRPATPHREVDDFDDNPPGPSSSAAPINSSSHLQPPNVYGAAFQLQSGDIPLQDLPSSSNNAPGNDAENEDSIPAHILAESRELAELHRIAWELTNDRGGINPTEGVDNDSESQYIDFEEPDDNPSHGAGTAVNNDASSEYEDFVEPNGQAIPNSSTQANTHHRESSRDNDSVFGNASASLPASQQGTPININYTAPHGVGMYPTVHQVHVVGAGSMHGNAGGGNNDLNEAGLAQGNIAPPTNNPVIVIAPAHPTPTNNPNHPHYASVSTGNPHVNAEYEDWADPEPLANTNNHVAGNAPIVIQEYACPIKFKQIIWILVGLTVFITVIVSIVLINKRTAQSKLRDDPEPPVPPYASFPTSGVSLTPPGRRRTITMRQKM